MKNTEERIRRVTIVVVTPESGKEQRRTWTAPEGECFARSGVKRILEAVLAWAKKQYPLTNFVVFQEDVADFRFLPEQMVNREQFKKRFVAAMLDSAPN